MWFVSDACTIGLFEYLSTLMLICAQPGKVTGLEQKIDPASKAGSSKGSQGQQQWTVGYR